MTMMSRRSGTDDDEWAMVMVPVVVVVVVPARWAVDDQVMMVSTVVRSGW